MTEAFTPPSMLWSPYARYEDCRAAQEEAFMAFCERRDQALRRTQQNRDMLEQQIVERAAAKQPHAFTESGQPPAGDAPTNPLNPQVWASFHLIAAE